MNHANTLVLQLKKLLGASINTLEHDIEKDIQ